MVKIYPKILKNLRNRHGISQQALAERTQGRNRVGVATIKRIEAADEVYDARRRVAEGLAQALGVSVETLSGEDQGGEEGERRNRMHGYLRIKHRLSSGNACSYDMVEYLYGIPFGYQIEIAPLLVALMAEGSLIWRRRKLSAFDKATENLSSVIRQAGHLGFAQYPENAVNQGRACENESIEKRDVLGHHISDATSKQGYNRRYHNPFVDFLRIIEAWVKSDHIVIDDDLQDDLPFYLIGDETFEKIAHGNDRRLGDVGHKSWYAVTRGLIRINDIPEKLLGDDSEEERLAWIASHVSDDEFDAYRKAEEEWSREWMKSAVELGLFQEANEND